ncbi:MAG: hypothetical protein ACJ8FY_15345 [Gemmataceae bacterium]
MAARRSVCPRCGSPVGIPSRQPTHQGTIAAPLTPLERLRHARNRGPTPAAPAVLPDIPRPAATRPLDPRLVHLLSSRGTRRSDLAGRRLENHWYECLIYPLRARQLFLGLALILTLISTGASVFLPHLLFEPTAIPSSVSLVRLASIFFLGTTLLILVVGLPCSFLECVLSSAAAGEIYYIRWSGQLLNVILFSGAKWLACFLAGPAVFAGAAALYWMYCGEENLLDWLIVIELGIVAIGYWIFALVAVTDQGRLRDLSPIAVIDMAHRLGGRALGLAAVAALLFLAHGLVMITGVAEVHNGTLKGWIFLAIGWVSGLFWSTFFCRLLGIWCYRTQPR